MANLLDTWIADQQWKAEDAMAEEIRCDTVIDDRLERMLETMQRGDIKVLPAGMTYAQVEPGNRLKILLIPDRMIVDLLISKTTRITNLPKQWRVAAISYDFYRQGIALKIESPEFERVQLGCEIPNLLAIFQDDPPPCQHDWLDATTRADGKARRRLCRICNKEELSEVDDVEEWPSFNFTFESPILSDGADAPQLVKISDNPTR